IQYSDSALRANIIVSSSRKRSSPLSPLRASAHRHCLLFAQALIAIVSSSPQRSSPVPQRLLLLLALLRIVGRPEHLRLLLLALSGRPVRTVLGLGALCRLG